MNLGRHTTLAFAALILCMVAAPVFASGEPDVGQTRWANPENARVADNGETVYRCGTDESGPKRVLSPDVRAQIDRLIAEGKVAAGGNIPVYVHVIYTSREGNVSDADIAAQIQVLNYNYSGRDYNGNPVSGAANTGYTFTLARTTRTQNNKWFRMTPGSNAETQAKNALAVNPGGALNLYTCKPGQNLLGWSVFPWMAQAGTSQDGVVIHYGSLPGGYLSPYNLGGTATHEIGHYLGLYHTFQGGCDTGTCDATGDLVCDTPAEASATSGCPSGKDTCPAPGLDPIHNYMDYSTDACYTNFTSGQDTRMNQQVLAYTTRSWIGATRIANATTAPANSGYQDNSNYRGKDFSQRQADNGEFVYRCATDESGPKHILSPDVRAQIDRWLAEGTVAAGGVIPVHVHVIYTSREGNISDADIAAQIQVLNYNYSGRDYNGSPVSGAANTGYSFTLASVDRTNNSKWFKMTPGSRAETQAKNALSMNPGSSLNLFTCKPSQNLLGWSVFPWMAQAGTSQDGVVIHYGSFPNGYLSPYNLGGTSTHEIGHYLGLYHTFQGGCDTGTCDASGDLVCDTPAENTSTSGCPSGKDTCPAPGLDPIHNYMDYSTDACYTNFTSGQDTRMNQQVLAYTTRSWIGATRIANGAGSIAYARGGSDLGLRVSPNPFNPRTKIEFSTVRDGHVSVRVFDVQGRVVSTLVDRELPSGIHSFTFDGERLASGVYWMRLQADGAQVVKRISLLK